MRRSCVLTRFQKHEIARRYVAGEKTSVLIKEFGVTRSTVTRYGRMAGGKRRGFLSDADKAEIARRYRAGESTYALAECFNASQPTIAAVLESQSVERRGASLARREYFFNEAAFDTVTEESAYWIGFLMADASIGKGKVFEITQTKSHRGHLNALQKFLGSNYPLYAKRSRPMTAGGKAYFPADCLKLQITSRRLCESLARFGIDKRKLFRQAGSLAADRHFWRGLIDGDGSLYFGKNGRRTDYPFIRALAVNRTLMEEFSQFVRTICPKCKAAVLRAVGVFEVRVPGRFAVLLAKILYSDCHVSLPRKLKIARQMFK